MRSLLRQPSRLVRMPCGHTLKISAFAGALDSAWISHKGDCPIAQLMARRFEKQRAAALARTKKKHAKKD